MLARAAEEYGEEPAAAAEVAPAGPPAGVTTLLHCFCLGCVFVALYCRHVGLYEDAGQAGAH